MIEGFDKEIDALLRQTAKGETAFAAANPKSKIQNPIISRLFSIKVADLNLINESNPARPTNAILRTS